MSLDDRLDEPVSRTMTPEVATVAAETPIEEAAQLLVNNRVSGMPVVDGAGIVVGIVSLTDFVVVFGARGHEGARDEDESAFYDAVRLDRLVSRLVPQAEGGGAGRVRDIMSTRLVMVRPEASLRDVARLMSKHRVHRVLVVDGHGKLCGIVSALDVVGVVAG